MSADVHHLKNGVLVAQIHIRDAGASGCVTCYTLVAWHDHITIKIGFRFFLLFSQRLLLLHCELGRHLLFKRRQLFRQIFQNILYVAVKHLLVGFRDVVAVFLADSDKVLVKNRDCHRGLGLLLDKSDYACSLAGGLEVVGIEVVVITYSLTGIAANEKNIADMLFLSGQRHFVEGLQFLLGEIDFDSLVAVFNLLFDNFFGVKILKRGIHSYSQSATLALQI